MTQSQLSQVSGVKSYDISRYCSGTRRPKPERAFCFEQLIGVPAKVWLTGTPDEIKAALEQATI